MNETKYFLKPNIQIEPLINKWHAHACTIAPQAAAQFIKNSHIRIMKSYIQMPFAHAAAVKNPTIAGGEYIDYEGKRVDEIKQLLEKTESDSHDLIEFSKAIQELDAMLKAVPEGSPLDELYSKIPSVLKGYVELTYDLYHQPSYRFIERLLYESPYYTKSLQSVSLAEVKTDDRPFIFSTPRLAADDSIHLNLSFDDSKIDDLAKLKFFPDTFENIKSHFDIPDDKDDVLKSFLTTESPIPLPKYEGEEIRVRYFGHACVFIETKNVSILIDPLISYKYETELERYTFESLPEKIDYVLLTHNHHDHVVMETLLQLRHRIGKIIVPRNGNGNLEDPSLKLVLEYTGFKNVYDIDELERMDIEDGFLMGVPFFGEHCDLNIRSKLVYLLDVKGKSFMFAADSNNLSPETYTYVQNIVGDLDTLFISQECTGAPMTWSYGAFFSTPVKREIDHKRRSDGPGYNSAMHMLKTFSFKNIYLYAMGSEPWLNYYMALKEEHIENTTNSLNKVISACADMGVNAEHLHIKKELLLSA